MQTPEGEPDNHCTECNSSDVSKLNTNLILILISYWILVLPDTEIDTQVEQTETQYLIFL